MPNAPRILAQFNAIDPSHGRADRLPLPLDQWPTWARWVRLVRLRDGSERGVGDTVRRLAGQPGEAYKALRVMLRIPCKCPERRDKWNAAYAYA
jgi:hypothetical protein